VLASTCQIGYWTALCKAPKCRYHSRSTALHGFDISAALTNSRNDALIMANILWSTMSSASAISSWKSSTTKATTSSWPRTPSSKAARARYRPDLCCSIFWMPDTDGVTLLKEWSTTGFLTMPVIMMSGHATIDTAVEATKIGALAFLEKAHYPAKTASRPWSRDWREARRA